MEFETKSLFPYFLEFTDKLKTTGIDTYQHGIKWTTRYPRKLDAEDWLYSCSDRYREYTEGHGYLEEMLTPSVNPIVKGYPNGAIFSFMVINGTTKTEYYYDPKSEQKFHRIQ